MKQLIGAFALITTLLAGAPLAFADPEETAPAIFDRGAHAYQEGRYEDAVDLFLKAYAIDPQPTLLYNVAQAYERLGDVRNALRSYRDFLRQAHPSDDERKMVDSRVQNLERRLREQGIQQVTVFSTPPGASVALDDKVVGKTPWTGEAPSGRHVVVIHLEGYVDARKDLVLVDRAVDLDVTLTAVPAAGAEPGAAPASEPKHSEPAATASSPKISPWTWTAFGVGAAGLTGSLIFELLRSGSETDAKNAPTQIQYHDDYETMKGRQTAARVLVGVGAAGVAVGGVLLYLDLSRGSAHGNETKTGLAMGCGRDSCGLVGRGAF